MDENKPMERAERRRKKSELEEKVEKDMEVPTTSLLNRFF